ncbi:DUF5305 domain-containing protein [Halomicroarcula sp. F13]|uniref:DUF5305 domain-containing protein n=1 Tax=Haloarcula rubra TaxID=2487747 RepID=A0AAW4PRU8_9EURY|nr:DUF5305 family protein [Halomicroarcula rubra]MBX0323017.1 DUF5305 domain-containing protein [Halomicroarcula rubra]
MTPPTTEAPYSSEMESISMGLHSQATVENAASFYTRGETITDMPVYLRSYTPTVTARLVTTPPATDRVQIDQRLTLVYEARTAGNEVFITQRQRLNRTNTATSGESVVTAARINVTEVARNVARLESEIGDAGQVHVYLDAESRYNTPTESSSLHYRGPIHISKGSYKIGHGSVQDELRPTDSPVRVDPAKTSSLPFPVLGAVTLPHTTLVFALLSLGGLVGAGLAVVYGNRFDADRERATLHKARYAEWISEGSLPAHHPINTAQLDTLEDLVDFAIDTEKRILYDPAQGKYAVFDPPIAYVYVEEPDLGIPDRP